MAKSTPLSSKPGPAVGIEFDHLGIRAARVSTDGNGGFALVRLENVPGDYAEDANLVDGLKQIKALMDIGPKDQVVTCLMGRQVAAQEVTFRRLPAEEMEPALRLELRKSLSFELGGSTVDYQLLDNEAKGETAQYLVAVAGSGILARHLKVMEKAGINPVAVDVLPVAAGNALWNWTGAPKGDSPNVAVHVGPNTSTIVIDGRRSPYFNRYVPFAAEDILSAASSVPENDKRIQALSDEIVRSLAFYEKSAFATGFGDILLMGEFLEASGFEEQLRRNSRLPIRKMDTPKRLGYPQTVLPGRFELALALAMRGED